MSREARRPRAFPLDQSRDGSCRGKPSRDIARDIFVRQVSARLSKRQCSTSEPFKSHQAQVPPEGITHKLASCPTGLLAESVKELFEIRVQPNGEGTSHVVRSTTNGDSRQHAVQLRAEALGSLTPTPPGESMT
jgi:hypothetical protein